MWVFRWSSTSVTMVVTVEEFGLQEDVVSSGAATTEEAEGLVAGLGIVLGSNFCREEDRVRTHRGMGTKASKDQGQEGWRRW